MRITCEKFQNSRNKQAKRERSTKNNNNNKTKIKKAEPEEAGSEDQVMGKKEKNKKSNSIYYSDCWEASTEQWTVNSMHAHIQSTTTNDEKSLIKVREANQTASKSIESYIHFLWHVFEIH